ncbi:hypothetical protein EXS73_02005 [Candidatus Pacearchaeota archaeon]|nr:hypothetical protein [Candidatus Pacearchaeota archaeon]
MPELYLFPHGKGSTATQKALEQEARELYDAEEPFFNASAHIRAYEREFRELSRLQPRRAHKLQATIPYQDVPTTQLSRLQ